MAKSKGITIEQFNQEVDKMIGKLPEFLLNTMEECLLIAKKDINKRIVDSGIDSEGNPLKAYTERYLQFKEDVGRYRGHVDFQLGNYSVNKAIAARAKRQLKKNSEATYFKEKPLNNLKKKIKSKKIKEAAAAIKASKRAKAIPKGARLWQSIQLTSKVQQGNNYKIVIAPLDKLNKDKASGLSVKRGDILAMSKIEIERLNDRFQKQYALFLSNSGFFVNFKSIK